MATSFLALQHFALVSLDGLRDVLLGSFFTVGFGYGGCRADVRRGVARAHGADEVLGLVGHKDFGSDFLPTMRTGKRTHLAARTFVAVYAKQMRRSGLELAIGPENFGPLEDRGAVEPKNDREFDFENR